MGSTFDWVCFFLVLRNSYLIFNFIDTEADIKNISIEYLKIISYGAIPMTIYQALRGYSEGITQTRIVFDQFWDLYFKYPI